MHNDQINRELGNHRNWTMLMGHTEVWRELDMNQGYTL